MEDDNIPPGYHAELDNYLNDEPCEQVEEYDEDDDSSDFED
jgi:hypothetical protein